MEEQQGCVCLDEDQITETVVRLKEDFSHEFGVDVPTEVISASVKEWLGRYMDQISEDLYETLSTPRNDEARELRRLIDDAIGDIPNFQPAQITIEAADVFSGQRTFSFERLAAMVAYIGYRGTNVYKTKLNKLLFYSDFVHFQLTGQSISGSRYIHLPYGPVPERYDGVLAKLSAVDTISIEQRGDYQLIKGWDDPIIGTLGNEERKTLDWVLVKFGTMTSSEITRQSHREKAYKFTRMGEPIAYEYAKFLEIFEEG